MICDDGSSFDLVNSSSYMLVCLFVCFACGKLRFFADLLADPLAALSTFGDSISLHVGFVATGDDWSPLWGDLAGSGDVFGVASGDEV